MKDISIIIVTYNSQDLILDCVKSIYQYLDIPESNLEVIIVDNSNFDNNKKLRDTLEPYSDKVIIYDNPKNGGYGQGNNIGINNAKGKICCVMNPDVRFSMPLIKNSIDFFSRNNTLALLSYKQRSSSDISFYIKPESRPSIGNAVWTKIINKLNLFSIKHNYLSGAFFFTDKAKFQEIGMFDEAIFLYHEEPDISNRIIKKNYNIIFDPSKEYIHLTENRGLNEKAFYEELKSLDYYIKKYHLDRKNIFSKYFSDYKFNLFLFKILNRKERILKTEQEIKIINNFKNKQNN
ncbi:glycosyltransferase [Epilithonimonas pallida]|uniref:Glycosyltransferase, GT2 family n=1 Tax=Epilithonimonas pallida TaxID=373671 RepID=A0ABY1R5B1_9FLAO|nr:glycosyltransferase [Epilithonimonas pallida]SMP94821.1 Glycosyltransferase, GT2 family [Epilithonimonas pallida]